MKEMDWLSSYHDINNIKRALIGISRLLKKPVNLTECLAWYLDNQDDIEQNFPQFYTDLINFANKQVSNSKS
jgi:acyl carrier protein phosphodiesterase